MQKKLFSILATYIMLLAIFVTPVAAADVTSASGTTTDSNVISPLASNYFSGITGKMNSLNGSQSQIFNISSGSMPPSPEVSGITLNVTVSSGSSPFSIVVKHPNGDFVQRYVGSSGSISITEFNNTNPSGTWQIYIYSTGLVSTATARMTVNYTY